MHGWGEEALGRPKRGQEAGLAHAHRGHVRASEMPLSSLDAIGLFGVSPC